MIRMIQFTALAVSLTLTACGGGSGMPSPGQVAVEFDRDDMSPQDQDGMPPRAADYDILALKFDTNPQTDGHLVAVEADPNETLFGDDFETIPGIVRLRAWSYGVDAADNLVDLSDAFGFGIALVGDPETNSQRVGDPHYERKLWPGRIDDNPALTGNVTWDGLLLGFTPGKEPVIGSASMHLDLSTLAGRADFTDLRYWAVGEPIVRDTGNTWGDGNLNYTIEVITDSRFSLVDGMSFRETGGDEGDLSGSFAGANHEGVVGTLKREDLKAAFGGIR